MLVAAHLITCRNCYANKIAVMACISSTFLVSRKKFSFLSANCYSEIASLSIFYLPLQISERICEHPVYIFYLFTYLFVDGEKVS